MSLQEIKPQEFYESVIKFSGDKIKQKEDLKRIIELSFNNNTLQGFQDLAFSAKYVTGLLSIVRVNNENVNEEYLSKIKAEYLEHINKVKDLLIELLEPGTSFIKEIFKKKYFELKPECIENLSSLCEDLSRVKNYLNEMKEEKKGF